MRIAGVVLLFLSVFTSCSEQYDHKGRTPLANIGSEFLYKEDVLSAMPAGMSGTDSAVFMDRCIKEWTEDALLYEKAKGNIPDNAEINTLVENYRKALIVHAYQQQLIEQKLSDELPEEEIRAYYEGHKELFVAERPLMKGLFVKVPLNAPELNNVRKWYKRNTPENVEHLEKYSFRNAVGYEYFCNRWMPVTDVMDKIPLAVPDMETYLQQNKTLEVKDTANYYFLNITDYLKAGEQEPYEFAAGKVRAILVNARRMSFIKEIKEDLYRKASERKRINYY